MQDRITNILNSFVKLSSAELDTFNNLLKPFDFEKRDVFLKQGQQVSQIAIVVSGLFEMYKMDEEGNEISIDFLFPDSFVTDYVSYLTGTPCEISIRAIQQSSVVIFEKQEVDILFDSSIQFQKLGRIIAERSFIEFVYRIREGFLSPEERYQRLLKEKPYWIQSIPQYKIASFLNISPEWLSKIRTKS